LASGFDAALQGVEITNWRHTGLWEYRWCPVKPGLRLFELAREAEQGGFIAESTGEHNADG
jgi:hypothetical protein